MIIICGFSTTRYDYWPLHGPPLRRGYYEDEQKKCYYEEAVSILLGLPLLAGTAGTTGRGPV